MPLEYSHQLGLENMCTSHQFFKRHLFLKLLFGLLAVCFICPPNSVNAQTNQLKVGDKVQVKFLNKWYEAEVTELVGKLMIRAKFDAPREKGKVWMFGLRNSVRPSAKSNKQSNTKKTKSKELEANKQRTWTSAQGNFTIEAVFVTSDGNDVTLKKSDGDEITVSLDNLSQKDNSYVKELLAGNKPSSRDGDDQTGESTVDDPENKIESMRNRAERLMNRGGQPASKNPGEIKTSDYRMADASTIDLNTELRATIASRKTIKPEYAGDSILVGDEKSPYKTLSLIFDQTHSKGVIAYDTSFEARNSNLSPVTAQIVDMAKGEVLASVGLPLKNTVPSAISPDGKKLISHVVGVGRTPVRVDVWEIQNGQVEQKAGWQMPLPGFGMTTWFHASFVNNEKVVTVSNEGKIVVWNVDDGQPVFQADLNWTMGNRCDFDICDSGKTLIGFHRKSKYSTSVDVVVIDLENGKVIGTLCKAARKNALAVSSDQTRIAVLGTNYLRIFDNDGKVVEEFTLSGGATTACDWIDNRFLTLTNTASSFVVDTKSRLKFWRYTAGSKIGRDPFYVDAVGNHWQLEGFAGQKKFLRRYRVPHDLAVAKIPDPNSVVALGPGMSVALRISIPGSRDENKQLADKWTERLNDCGIKIDPNSNIENFAKVSRGGSETAIYESTVGETQSATTYSSVLVVEVRKDNQPIWGTAKTIKGIAPNVLMVKSGETAQSKINEYNRGGPGTNFFFDVILPKYVIVNPHGNIFGYSTAKKGTFADTETEKSQNNALNPQRSRGNLRRKN